MRTFKRVQGMVALARQEGAFVGKVDDALFDLQTGMVSGWRVKTGAVFSKSGGVSASDVELLGRDVVVVRAESAIEWVSGSKGKAPDGRAWASVWLGTGVLTRSGSAVGEVKDLVVDDRGDRIYALLLSDGRLVGIDARAQLGPSAVILESDAVPVTLPEDEGKEAWWDAIRAALARP